MAEIEEDMDFGSIVNDDVERKRVQTATDEIASLLRINQAGQAVKIGYTNFPTQTRDAQVKSLACDAFVRALASVEKSQIDDLIKNASDLERGTMMKYVCKGFASLDKKTCETMLVWHGKLVEICGLGIIMRVMTERHV